ncbi:MAG TPA: cobalamin-binding protein [Bacteroides sp.]|nr:cobalamin-binding protein [Bacteroides sp.]
MSTILEQISKCIEFGKINLASPYPPDMKEQEGADELTKKAIDEGIDPNAILDEALIPAMAIVGNKFSKNEIFVPQMLMSAKAMGASMEHIRPFFQSGAAKRKGVFVVGTVAGDLHDIGKNLVAMMVEGGGWEVIDLGVDVASAKFEESINQHPGCIIGLSALLTTTMTNMGTTVKELKAKYPETQILIGGAPVTTEFCEQIGANFYSPDPQGAVNFLNTIAS